MRRFEGKVAVITGGAGGMGYSHAVRLIAEGASVVIFDLRGAKEAAERLMAECGGKAIGVQGNVTVYEDCEKAMAAAVENFGRLDILINNAGIMGKTSIYALDEKVWDAMQDVNVKGVLFCTKAAVQHMVKQHYGKIVNVSSIAGLGVRSPAGVAYGVSKAAVASLTKYTAMELGKEGICCNAVAPGMILTEMTYAGRTAEEVKMLETNTYNVTCSGRIGTVEDVTAGILYLASDEASYVNGRILEIDGGRMDHIGY